MNDDELDRFVAERIKKKEAEEKAQAEYARAKAEAETRELSTIMQDTAKTLQVKLNQKANQIIETSPEIDKKMEETTNKLVDIGLETQQNQVEAELKKSKKLKAKADFELKEDQYRAFGQDTSPEEAWKKYIITWGYNFWFVIISLICFVSLAPFYIFMRVIKTQSGVLKFVSIAIGVILLLICLGGFTCLVLRWCGVW